MRGLAILPILLLGVGCHGACQPRIHGCHPEPGGPYAEAKRCPPSHREPCEVPTPPARVEVKPPEEIHVKAPPARVVVHTPPAAPVMAQGMVPQAAPALVQAAVPQQMTMIAASVESVPTSRAIPTVGLDWIRIPFPILRIFAVPTRDEVIVRVPQPQFVAAPQVAVAPAAVQQVQYAAPAAFHPVAQVCVAPQPAACASNAAAPAASPRLLTPQEAAEIRAQIQALQSALQQLNPPCPKDAGQP